MAIEQLEFQHFRNITHVKLEPSPRINIIFGNNGEGKTSFLEAIYYLSLGRSFRSHLLSRIIQHNQDKFTLFAKIDKQTVGIGKTQEGDGQIKLAGDNIRSTAELTQLLPIQLVNPDAYLLLNDGPKFRRAFLDWGVFHVEPSFFEAWRNMQRCLKQRNLALKMKAPYEEIKLWNPILTESALVIDRLRESYFQQLEPKFIDILSKLIKIKELSVAYQRGWPKMESLPALLEKNLSSDYRLGRTQYGPHRADIDIRIDGVPAKDVLSRGQQKIFVYALRLAQGVLFTEQTGKTCIYLIDDLPAELDEEKRETILKMLLSFNSQLFVTAIELEDLGCLLQDTKTKVFHVEHGRLFVHELGEKLEC